jgi:hypothetical protein
VGVGDRLDDREAEAIPAGLDGTVVLGAGNWGTPCARMQTAILRSIAIVCAEGCVVEPGPGKPPPMNL